MGKVTVEGLIKPGDPLLKQQSIVLGRPWRTTAEDLRRKKAKEKAKAEKQKEADDAG